MRYRLALLSLAVSVGVAGNVSATPAPECGVFRIGWALSAPKDGEIRELYWATTNYTELWMTLKPRQPTLGQRGVPELLLVVSICFRGRTMPSPQESAELRVQVNRNFIAAPAPDPHLEIVIDRDIRHELTGSKFKHRTEYPAECRSGDGCVYTAILVDLPIEMLRRIADARTVTGTISGTPFELSDAQRRELETFVRRIAVD